MACACQGAEVLTISSQTRKAGPYTGNGSTTTFPFSFKVFLNTDVLVVRTDLNGIETTLTLNTDYTISLNSNQDSNAGGNVVLPSALTSGYLLTISSKVPLLQQTDFTNQGGFYPAVLNASMDRLTIITQQLNEQVSRAVKTGISSGITPDQLLAQITASVASAAASATASQTSANASSASAAASAASAASAAAAATDAAIAMSIALG